MLPDRVSNPGPLTYESGAYRLHYAARLTIVTRYGKIVRFNPVLHVYNLEVFIVSFNKIIA